MIPIRLLFSANSKRMTEVIKSSFLFTARVAGTILKGIGSIIAYAVLVMWALWPHWKDDCD